ncbi:MAG TPA: hypothetical protein VK188_08195 [Holophaga sp.]|nr:hypothetical protein [Holophaga sp.]
MLPDWTDLKERCAERWTSGVARMDGILGPRFEAWMARPGFPILFWMAIFAMAAVALQALRARPPRAWAVLLAALAGALFGSRLRRMTGTFRRPLDPLERAWAKGDVAAAHALGMAYFRGAPGVPQSRELARGWFQAGAEAGDRGCMKMLAECLRWGLGGDRDLAGAEAWELAARPGNIPERAGEDPSAHLDG